MIVFTNTLTPRLRYIFDFIGKEITGDPFQVTTDPAVFRDFDGPKLNYSNSEVTEAEFRIEPAPLLFEAGIKEQKTVIFEVNGYRAFFKTTGNFPFDIFAASFYLLSRYEEYLPHKKDIYGRYAHENSLASREKFLHLPVVNIWIENLRKVLQNKFPQFKSYHPPFRFLPTYDIDEAFSYRHKQWWRTVGGIMRSLKSGQWSAITERVNVLRNKNADPYDSFEWMNALNKQHKLEPVYFFLVAGKTGRYDKNILPSKRVMQDLIRDHSARYKIGIHPSWQSGDEVRKVRFEILKLGHISGKQITSSRQHFIRFTLPYTYRELIASGIQSDYSMGYGSINGFRASVTTSFYWYDLEKEEQSTLLLHPFCFMEANSFYEQRLSPEQAFEELEHYHNVVRSVNGTLITIWHNTFFGRGVMFKGWKEMYQRFITSIYS